MGIFRRSKSKREPHPHPNAPANKMYEGVSFPAEVDVTITPVARNNKLRYRWSFTFERFQKEGQSNTQMGAVKDASAVAWELVERKREREAHMAQRQIRI